MFDLDTQEEEEEEDEVIDFLVEGPIYPGCKPSKNPIFRRKEDKSV